MPIPAIDLLLLGALCSAASCGAARWGGRRALRQLVAGRGGRPLAPQLTAARAPLLLRPGAVVALGPDDFQCEGVVTVDDDGRATRLYRLVDGARVRWLVVRPGLAPLLCDPLRGPFEGATAHTAPDRLRHGESDYRLVARAPVRVRSLGATGLPGNDERGWLNEYAGAAGRGILALALGDHTLGLAGQPLPVGFLDTYTTG